MREHLSIRLGDSVSQMRLDQAIASQVGISRSLVAKLIKQGDLKINGRLPRKSDEVFAGDQVEILLPDTSEKTLETPAELPILYEDADVVAVNKPVGMAAHAAPGWEGATVVGALLAKGCQISTSGPKERCGVVHRLDVGTSGVMVVAKTELAFEALKRDFHDRKVQKIYHALVQGYIEPAEGTIEAPIGRHPSRDFRMAVVEGGKSAISHYRTLERFLGACLVQVHLETGRTHQIRVHMQAIQHCIVGDPIYGGNPALAKQLGLKRQWLHAVSLTFTHPRTQKELTVNAPLTKDLVVALEVLRSREGC